MTDIRIIQDMLVGIDFIGNDDGNRSLDCEANAWHRIPAAKCRGRRPEDFAKTDFVMGEIYRLQRFWPFHQLLKNKHPLLQLGNVEANARTMDGVNQQRAISHARAFGFLHNNGLLQQCLKAESESFRQHVDDLLRCPTSLYQIKDYHRATYQECRRIKFCPYCVSRSAWDLSIRLQRTRPTASPLLALLVYEHALDDWQQFDSSTELARTLNQIRKRTKQEFRRAAEMWLCDGGVIAQQVVPRLHRFLHDGRELLPVDGTTELVLRTAMLIPVTTTLAHACEQECEGPDRDHAIQSLWSSAISTGRSSSLSTLNAVDLRPQTSSAFRDLVMGTSPGLNRDARVKGVRGLLVPAIWSLAPEGLHQLCFRALKHWRSYNLFGTWCQNVRRPTRSHKFENSTPEAIACGMRKQKLKNANDRRHAIKFARIERLMPQAVPIFDAYQSTHGKVPGRAIAQKLIEQVIPEITERDTRQLVAAYKSTKEIQ